MMDETQSFSSTKNNSAHVSLRPLAKRFSSKMRQAMGCNRTADAAKLTDGFVFAIQQNLFTVNIELTVLAIEAVLLWRTDDVFVLGDVGNFTRFGVGFFDQISGDYEQRSGDKRGHNGDGIS